MESRQLSVSPILGVDDSRTLFFCGAESLTPRLTMRGVRHTRHIHCLWCRLFTLLAVERDTPCTSTLQGAVDGYMSKTQGLSCTCTCMDNRSMCCSSRCLHHRDLSYTWTCLHHRDLSCTWTCLNYRGPCSI
jgi:hypothetical protein